MIVVTIIKWLFIVAGSLYLLGGVVTVLFSFVSPWQLLPLWVRFFLWPWLWWG